MSADDLTKALRAFVLDVVKGDHVETEQQPQQPKKADAFWLLLLVADFALLLWLLPSAVLKSEQVDALSKFVPWIGSGAYVLGYTWFRDHMLRWTRRRWFKGVEAAALPIFSILLFAPIIPIHMEVQPNDAQVWVDGKQLLRKHENGHWNVPLKLRTHHVEIKPAQQPLKAESRSIDLPWWRLFTAFFSGSRNFYLPLIYPVGIASVMDKGYTIDIKREPSDGHNEFDPNFLEEYLEKNGFAQVGPSRDTLRRRLAAEQHDVTVHLPYGVYEITATARKEGCKKTQQFEAKPGGAVKVNLPELCR